MRPGTGRCTYMNDVDLYAELVGKYTSLMDPMGIDYQHIPPNEKFGTSSSSKPLERIIFQEDTWRIIP